MKDNFAMYSHFAKLTFLLYLSPYDGNTVLQACDDAIEPLLILKVNIKP